MPQNVVRASRGLVLSSSAIGVNRVDCCVLARYGVVWICYGVPLFSAWFWSIGGFEMKKIALALIFMLSTFSVSFAAWDDTFMNIYNDKGIDDAVDNAYNKDKVVVDSIVEKGMGLHLGIEEAGGTEGEKRLLTPDLIKALYCAGISGEDIKASADAWNTVAAQEWSNTSDVEWEITEKDVFLGFKKANTECAEITARSRAFVPGSNNTGFVSPYNFSQ